MAVGYRRRKHARDVAIQPSIGQDRHPVVTAN